MGKVQRPCDWCGKPIFRYPSQFRGKKRIFCCRKCFDAYSTKRLNPEGYAYKDFSKSSAFLHEHNAEFNKRRMTPEVRIKLRQAHLNTGEGKTYRKFLSKPEHRVVAELMLGRPLKPGEVVHHIDGDKRNNDPKNLMVFGSQSEHAAFHAKNAGGEHDEI